MIKKYYKIRFKLLEPLSLGSGENKFSDGDILKDCHGVPFIPGSSLCGAYRKCFKDQVADQYFGKLIEPKKDDADKENLKANEVSSVIVYDATLVSDYCATEIRDNVGLDDFKVAKEGAKFDFELVQPGALFETFIEQDMTDNDIDIGDIIAQKMYMGDLCLGHKSMRGYGKVKGTDIWKREFVIPDFEVGIPKDGLSEDEQRKLDEWISFDMYDDNEFTDKVPVKAQNQIESDHIHIELGLKQQGGISIRRYTTELTEDGKNQPDYVQMHYGEGRDEEPVIPGTSWSGAFRHHIEKLLPADRKDHIVEKYFGFSRKKEKKISKIRFSESEIKGAKSKIIMRNAIDRFTGGTIDGALYTEKSYFGGKTDLTITLPKLDGEEDILFQNALAASIADLNEGVLSIGGLTSVGRGLFRVEECSFNNKQIYSNPDKNDKDKDGSKASEKLYDKLIQAMRPENNIDNNWEEER